MQIATRNKPINQGILILEAEFLKNNKVKNDNGIIHNARANFTVVATCRASSPYLLAAPTTELVS